MMLIMHKDLVTHRKSHEISIKMQGFSLNTVDHNVIGEVERHAKKIEFGQNRKIQS